MQAVGEQFTEVNLTKFLCGIYTPVFSKLKIKKLSYFGILENYPFLEVRSWMKDNILPEKLIPREIFTADIQH